jgi:hypothetical protein
LTQQVKIDYGWTPGEIFTKDKTVPAIAIPTTGDRATEMRNRAVIPMSQIAPENLSASYDFIRKNRAGFANKTDAQIGAALRSNIERAAALAATGATADEVKSVLLGNK